MQVKIISVGKIKDKNIRGAMEEYLKQMHKYCHLEIIEVEDESTKQEINLVKEKEAERINRYIDEDYYKILLEINAKQMTSEQLADKFSQIASFQNGKVLFIIGGSYGVSEEIKNKVDLKLSFSQMTFPHQLFRLLLIEQIYRAFKINKNEPYHK